MTTVNERIICKMIVNLRNEKSMEPQKLLLKTYLSGGDQVRLVAVFPLHEEHQLATRICSADDSFRLEIAVESSWLPIVIIGLFLLSTSIRLSFALFIVLLGFLSILVSFDDVRAV